LSVDYTDDPQRYERPAVSTFSARFRELREFGFDSFDHLTDALLQAVSANAANLTTLGLDSQRQSNPLFSSVGLAAIGRCVALQKLTLEIYQEHAQLLTAGVLRSWRSCATLRDVTFEGFSLGGDDATNALACFAALSTLPALQSLHIDVWREATLRGLAALATPTLSVFIQLDKESSAASTAMSAMAAGLQRLETVR
jgi:hypothetical protein